MIQYNETEFFLTGIGQTPNATTANLLIVCTREEVNAKLATLYKFCSILGWYLGGYADIENHNWASRPIRIQAFGGAPSGPSHGGRLGFDCNFMPVITADNVRLALAFWREGLRLRHVHESYSFLSFFKVIESQHQDGRTRRDWIDSQLPMLTGTAGERVQALVAQGLNVSTHLFESCRCAVAHATMGREIVDPDLPADRIRLRSDIVVIKELAWRYISAVLEVPTEAVAASVRNRLRPIHCVMDERAVARLSAGETISRRATGLHGQLVDIRAWAKQPDPQLQGLRLRVVSAEAGWVQMFAVNPSHTLAVYFAFDFNSGRAHTDLDQSTYSVAPERGRVEEAVAIINYRKEVLQNGLIEIVFADNLVVQCEILIPMNIDIGESVRRMDALVAKLLEDVQPA